MIVLFKQVDLGFERIADYGDDFDAALVDANSHAGWQIEKQTESGSSVLAYHYVELNN